MEKISQILENDLNKSYTTSVKASDIIKQTSYFKEKKVEKTRPSLFKSKVFCSLYFASLIFLIGLFLFCAFSFSDLELKMLSNKVLTDSEYKLVNTFYKKEIKSKDVLYDDDNVYLSISIIDCFEKDYYYLIEYKVFNDSYGIYLNDKLLKSFCDETHVYLYSINKDIKNSFELSIIYGLSLNYNIVYKKQIFL